MAANTVCYLEDGVPVNFIFEVTGLGPFAREFKHTRRMLFHGRRIPVLRLERILKSKLAIGRDKDLIHVQLIRDFLRCRRVASACPGWGTRFESAPAKGRPCPPKPQVT